MPAIVAPPGIEKEKPVASKGPLLITVVGELFAKVAYPELPVTSDGLVHVAPVPVEQFNGPCAPVEFAEYRPDAAYDTTMPLNTAPTGTDSPVMDARRFALLVCFPKPEFVNSTVAMLLLENILLGLTHAGVNEPTLVFTADPVLLSSNPSPIVTLA